MSPVLTAAVLIVSLARAGWREELAAPFKVFNKPSNQREWSEDVAVLAEITILDTDRVRIKNFRNFEYRTTSDWTPRYYPSEYFFSELESVWYFVEPFAAMGQAHTFLSFGFKGNRYLAISIEIRKRKGDSFSPWRGLWNNFEIVYVLGDERDIARLRSNFRKNDVYLYPLKVARGQAQALLVDMLTRAESLRQTPEFYNTLTNNCMTNILRHANRVAPKPIGWSWRTLPPGYSDRLAYDLGLIDTDLPFEKARERFKINERALAAGSAPDFSAQIRR